MRRCQVAVRTRRRWVVVSTEGCEAEVLAGVVNLVKRADSSGFSIIFELLVSPTTISQLISQPFTKKIVVAMAFVMGIESFQ